MFKFLLMGIFLLVPAASFAGAPLVLHGTKQGKPATQAEKNEQLVKLVGTYCPSAVTGLWCHDAIETNPQETAYNIYCNCSGEKLKAVDTCLGILASRGVRANGNFLQIMSKDKNTIRNYGSDGYSEISADNKKGCNFIDPRGAKLRCMMRSASKHPAGPDPFYDNRCVATREALMKKVLDDALKDYQGEPPEIDCQKALFTAFKPVQPVEEGINGQAMPNAGGDFLEKPAN